MPDFEEALQVKERAKERLFAIPGVHCIAIGAKQTAGQYSDKLAIVVFVTRKRPLDQLHPDEVIPKEIDGVEVDVVESPIPRLHSEDRSTYPSLRGGIQIWAGGDHRGEGTLGFIAQSKDGQKIFAVTNQHVLLFTRNVATNLNVNVTPNNDLGLRPSFQVDFTALGTIDKGTVVAAKIARQASQSPFAIDRFDVVFSVPDGFSAENVANKIRDEINKLDVVDVTLVGSSLTVKPTSGFRGVNVDCHAFGRKLTESSHLSASVAGNVITFSGQASDPGGALVNFNLGGAQPSFGVFVPVSGGDDGTAVATNTALALNALKNSPRLSQALSSVTVQRTGTNVTIQPTEEVECEVIKDDRVGHPTNCFCCRHHKRCSDRIGRVVAAALDLDAALIQLDGEQKYIAKVEDIPENGGAVHGTYDIKAEDTKGVGFSVQKRGRTTRLTTGKVHTLAAEGIISLTSQDPGNRSFFHRYYKNAIRIDRDSGNFSEGGDSGSALMDHNNNVVGLVFGGSEDSGDGHGLASPIADVIKAFEAFNLVVSTTTEPAKELVVPGPSFNFAALPADGATLPVTGGVPLFDDLRKAETEIEAIPAGKVLSDAVRRHASEGYQLVTTNKRVGAVWKRNGGPQLFSAVLQILRKPTSRLPEQIAGKPLSECLTKIRNAFERYGSPAFVADLRLQGDQLIRLMSLSYNEVKAELESAQPG